MNALFLKDLAAKTHRGLRGRVEDGKSGGGLCYGYKVIQQTDGRGQPVRGDREIDPAEADVVRRVFRDFAAGVGPRTIARMLNDEGVPGPNGKPWGDTTIRGHVKRGTGLVNNELYVGRLIWNRLRYVKDSADRQAGLAPQSESRPDHHRGARVPASSTKRSGRRSAPARPRSPSSTPTSPRRSASTTSAIGSAARAAALASLRAHLCGWATEKDPRNHRGHQGRDVPGSMKSEMDALEARKAH
ncbi:MAG: recombinase family protein [Amaricoccus sp.]